MYDIAKKISGKAAGVELIEENRRFSTTKQLQFRDTGLYFHSSVDGQLDGVADTKFRMAAPDSEIQGLASTVILNCGRVMAENGFPHNDVTQTEQAAAYCKVADGSSFANLAVSGAEAGYAAKAYEICMEDSLKNKAAVTPAAAVVPQSSYQPV